MGDVAALSGWLLAGVVAGVFVAGMGVFLILLSRWSRPPAPPLRCPVCGQASVGRYRHRRHVRRGHPPALPEFPADAGTRTMPISYRRGPRNPWGRDVR